MSTKTPEGASRVTLFTGGTDGLGRAIAIMLAERGHRTFAAGRSTERIASLNQLVQQRKLPLAALELDLSSDESVDRAAAQIEPSAGPV
jgi:NAD(P)-dependent dehydrogenase (short-subunit alcohol dehydrogenase family)